MYGNAPLAIGTILSGSLLLTACGNHHTVSRVTSSGPVTPSAALNISDKERFAGTLAIHNQVRAQHGLSRLQWSTKLSNYAQEWANHLASRNNCRMRHRPKGSPYGENLWWASPRLWSNGMRELQYVTIERVVNDWANERPYYDYQRNRCQIGQQCGHYTQIVWRDTTHVGCAYQQCADKSQLWVCNYNPPGNYIGERPY